MSVRTFSLLAGIALGMIATDGASAQPIFHNIPATMTAAPLMGLTPAYYDARTGAYVNPYAKGGYHAQSPSDLYYNYPAAGEGYYSPSTPYGGSSYQRYPYGGPSYYYSPSYSGFYPLLFFGGFGGQGRTTTGGHTTR